MANLPADSPIDVYNLNGILVQQIKTNDDGKAQVDIISQQNGVYIIRSKAGVFKILKK